MEIEENQNGPLPSAMDRFRLARKSEGWQADGCLQFQKEGTMRRREFLATMGTAAAISSASQAFAQPGGGGPQKVNVANYVALEAKPGKEEALAEFLRQGKAWVEAEPATIAWFGVRLGPSTFAIFDAFPDEAGRQAHLNGKLISALMKYKVGDLLAQPPSIQKADVLVAKLPG
jgi:quinol monooxygenase YgiN